MEFVKKFLGDFRKTLLGGIPGETFNGNHKGTPAESPQGLVVDLPDEFLERFQK